MLIIDRFAYTNRLTGLSPFIKTGLSFAMIIVSVATSNPAVCAILCITAAALTLIVAGIPASSYLKMLSVPAIYMAVGIFPIVVSFGFGKPPDGGMWTAEFMSFYLNITQETLSSGLKVTMRAVSAMMSMYLYILTTPCSQQVKVFKKLHIPAVFTEIYVLTYRFIAVFFEEATDIHTAQKMRFGYSSRQNSMRSLAILIKSLFVRIMTRYSEMEDILEIKHFNGNFYI